MLSSFSLRKGLDPYYFTQIILFVAVVIPGIQYHPFNESHSTPVSLSPSMPCEKAYYDALICITPCLPYVQYYPL